MSVATLHTPVRQKSDQSDMIGLIILGVGFTMLTWPILGLVFTWSVLTSDTRPPLGFSKKAAGLVFLASWVAMLGLILLRLHWDTLSLAWILGYSGPYIAGMIGALLFVLILCGYFGTEESG